jgi:hypothetical protein
VTASSNKPVVVFDPSVHSIVWKTPCIIGSGIDALISMFDQDTDAICTIVRRDHNMREYTYTCGVKAI